MSGTVTKKKAVATWTLELNTNCPHCGKYVDLLEYADFWDGRELEACEHGTARSKDVDVSCPECDAEFSVCCEY